MMADATSDGLAANGQQPSTKEHVCIQISWNAHFLLRWPTWEAKTCQVEHQSAVAFQQKLT
jgi:hypothetical protein